MINMFLGRLFKSSEREAKGDGEPWLTPAIIEGASEDWTFLIRRT